MRGRGVPADLRADVYRRDGYRCVAPLLDPDGAGECRDVHGRVVRHINGMLDPIALTLDHVKDQPRLGRRAPDDRAHLVTLCWGHHVHSAWATSHRPELRDYLVRAEAATP